uniref:beta-ketoacyl-[acyl-carrier-protein] synthase III n=1 Tax=Chromera velia CCMP2878 TaxID=1169474 RepID=A0A0G4H833_9ALVE|mmetsp:Transcript_3894/g.8003  ORF Transcript_3894/g.8003 Transcript_3894/m.8003 type:complete len:394 (-) Transcript_3894:660-1841(-)|eukprot:Cvel_25041.t1-p1 / transcript=Cvel_25041.t1 / gene=Cvel_25041 / organism=Chromera_velia_CCMP2878 / gene_product=3-oxoacyl-[acyl-carrier-protein] synthase III,, putative / transcript_product=3-oxoacyl-[acyl-carrier-protein] synthase III,, putative / location=Cvel_scaffold2782:21206-23676(-) / protein_length=393 / sequence_SO=supercontig / SO=protein_coding / is_pseudo=false
MVSMWVFVCLCVSLSWYAAEGFLSRPLLSSLPFSPSGSSPSFEFRKRRSETAPSALSAEGGPSLQLKIRPVGIGSCAPPTVITNSDLESIVETDDEWIRTRTGISRRHVLQEGETLQGLAVEASKKALENANFNPENLDLVVLATSSSEDLFGDATGIAAGIGATNAVAFDLTAACSGFVFSMISAGLFLHSGVYKSCLVIGADALSRWVDWKDRNTCILFGDAAGAVLFEACGEGEGSVLAYDLHSDGNRRPQLCLPMQSKREDLTGGKGHVTKGEFGDISMNGREVFKFATREVPASIKLSLEKADLTVDKVDWLLLHQANYRIMEAVADRLGLPASKILSNLDEFGNTSSASIPVALEQAVREGKVKKGDVIAMAGFGAGLSWGSAVVRW